LLVRERREKEKETRREDLSKWRCTTGGAGKKKRRGLSGRSSPSSKKKGRGKEAT